MPAQVHVVDDVSVGAEIAKADVSKAYRNVPVHPSDRWLLGMEWKGTVLVDGTQPFDLRSVPLLFSALGDAVEWVAKLRGASWLQHYIDDFVAVGAAGMGECSHTMRVFKRTCSLLGMPLDDKKEEGPVEMLTFLGLELDSRKGEVKLPETCLRDLRTKLQERRGMKSCHERSPVDHWTPESCMQSGESRQVVPAESIGSQRDSKTSEQGSAPERIGLSRHWQFGLHWNGVSIMRSIVAAAVRSLKLRSCWTSPACGGAEPHGRPSGSS